ncbi:DUF58 domain-containing protein [Zavarzinia compransoris]|uniref:DUF58 domain-containing protein n=1 Tax=Zavarzinia compransoris TaxID=1264899 RepID=UPI0010EAD36A|nr:DUF58 domain-containing protein [Zavarzinia compransoris]TDP46150.1 uncharacterized protein DUF58 [Zavarzinia compransoris]
MPVSALRGEALGAGLPPLLVAAERVAATVDQGVHGRRRVGQGDSFWQFRPYRPGDEIRDIDWRQSARGDRVFVREREWEAAQTVFLWVDRSASMAFASDRKLETKRDRAALLGLALASLLVRGGERVGLIGQETAGHTGRAWLVTLAETLALPAPAEASLPPAAALPRDCRAVIIGDLLRPEAEIEALVEGFAARGVSGHLLQVLDPAEADFPYEGRNRFLGLEGEGRLLVGRAETLAEAYRARIAAHRDAIETLARRTGWTVIHHRTDRPAASALLALFLALADLGRR